MPRWQPIEKFAIDPSESIPLGAPALISKNWTWGIDVDRYSRSNCQITGKVNELPSACQRSLRPPHYQYRSSTKLLGLPCFALGKPRCMSAFSISPSMSGLPHSITEEELGRIGEPTADSN